MASWKLVSLVQIDEDGVGDERSCVAVIEAVRSSQGLWYFERERGSTVCAYHSCEAQRLLTSLSVGMEHQPADIANWNGERPESPAMRNTRGSQKHMHNDITASSNEMLASLGFITIQLIRMNIDHEYYFHHPI